VVPVSSSIRPWLLALSSSRTKHCINLILPGAVCGTADLQKQVRLGRLGLQLLPQVWWWGCLLGCRKARAAAAMAARARRHAAASAAEPPVR
jgi:hypothetical protein